MKNDHPLQINMCSECGALGMSLDDGGAVADLLGGRVWSEEWSLRGMLWNISLLSSSLLPVPGHHDRTSFLPRQAIPPHHF